jgi:hypothetical protein
MVETSLFKNSGIYLIKTSEIFLIKNSLPNDMTPKRGPPNKPNKLKFKIKF